MPGCIGMPDACCLQIHTLWPLGGLHTPTVRGPGQVDLWVVQIFFGGTGILRSHRAWVWVDAREFFTTY